MAAWEDLSMHEKHAFIKTAVKNGIKDLGSIRSKYNEYDDGEDIIDGGTLPEVEVVYNRNAMKIANNSSARFVQRINDQNRQTIKDWENPNAVATHKLGWATDDNGDAIVFPNVQEINGKLHDFTDPKYKHGEWDAFDRAIENNNYLRMTPEEAKWYTENYKKYAPEFDKYANGGNLYPDGEEYTAEDGATLLPEITVNGYRPIELYTYYPVISQFPFTGHSELYVPLNSHFMKPQELNPSLETVPFGAVDKRMDSKDYNLITNNCADATLGALNYMFGTKESPNLFTTPGDVQDFAIEKLGGKATELKDGRIKVVIPRNKDNYQVLTNKFIDWTLTQDDKTASIFNETQRIKANGGELDFLSKPFSYKPIPKVRY